MNRKVMFRRWVIIVLCLNLIMDNAFWIHHWMLYVCPSTLIGLQFLDWVLE